MIAAVRLLLATVRGLWARYERAVVYLALPALIVLAVLCWPHAAPPAPRPVPPAVVKADAAAAHADTVYVTVTRTVVRRAATYDSARAAVPAFSTADSAGRVRVDTLFVAAADSVRRAVTDIETAARQRHAADSAQVAALRLFTVDLQRDLAHSEPRCRVLGLPCPSRRRSFLAGAVLGAAGVATLAHALR